jgi:hypothetical protein
MRDIGYTLESALADVIDNAIAAGATDVHIYVDTTTPNVKLGIIDNGSGMSRTELLSAMRLGSRNPRNGRATGDLGRFGLGMKTASFSQCRRLTVVARKGGVASAAVWDLDHVASTDQWELLTPDHIEDIPFVDQLTGDGALVLWERMDRAIEQQASNAALRHFVQRLDESRSHLELVFHRYLAGERGRRRVRILLNALPLNAFDPFHASHPATLKGQTEIVQVAGEEVTITPFTLPHHRNVTKAEWEHYARPEGYLKTQGFYLYREGRLIVHGTWFGLARQAELTKLCRVRIDMPATLDSQWHVDVKKSFARPPLQVRERLQRLIGEIGAPSRRIYERRGRTLYEAKLPMWSRVQADNAIVYRLNGENPMLSDFLLSLPTSHRANFERLCRVISASLPMDALFADLAGSPDAVKHEALDDALFGDLLRRTLAALAAKGVEPRLIPPMLRAAEPFRSNWERTEDMLDAINGEAN